MKQSEIMRGQGYVTAMEASQKFGRHVTTIYRLVESQAVEGTRIGRAWYVKWASLVSYANKQDPHAAQLLGLTEQAAAAKE